MSEKITISADEHWKRAYVFAAVWLPIQAYMTYVAVKWAVVHAMQILRQFDSL